MLSIKIIKLCVLSLLISAHAQTALGFEPFFEFTSRLNDKRGHLGIRQELPLGETNSYSVGLDYSEGTSNGTSLTEVAASFLRLKPLASTLHWGTGVNFGFGRALAHETEISSYYYLPSFRLGIYDVTIYPGEGGGVVGLGIDVNTLISSNRILRDKLSEELNGLSPFITIGMKF